MFTRATVVILVTLCTVSFAFADASNNSVTNYSSEQTADALDWVKDSDANQCHGYYLEPDLGNMDTNLTSSDITHQTINITASGAELKTDGVSTLTNVRIQQPGRLVTGDSAQLNRDGKTDEVKTIDLKGKVVIREPSKMTIGDAAHITPNTDEGTYSNVLYRLALNLQPIKLLKTPEHPDQYKVTGLIAHGAATQMDQTKKTYYVLKDATYSTCSPENSVWHIKAKEIDLNHATGRGKAYHTILYYRSMPVFYTPYATFPIDKRRESGFLSPIYGSSSQNGISLSFPYYWNIAPNYDMTLTPNFYSKRGVLMTTSNRFLTRKSKGDVELGIIPNDKAFSTFQTNGQQEYAGNPALNRLMDASPTRWSYHMQDSTTVAQNLTANVDYTRVSDDYYQQDFGLRSATPGQLLQQAYLNYNQNFWNAQVLAQEYQTLHPVTMLGNTNQYERLPDFTFNVNYPALTHLTYLLKTESVDFSRQLNPGESFPSQSGDPTSGMRNNLQPGISLPFIENFGYIKPTLQVEATDYSLKNQPVGYTNNITRTLPIFNVDSGLYFDRATQIFKHDYQQTLEPRLYYLYVPYRGQNEIPIFDTSLQNLTFDQLFQTNRFTSIDRIGNANQVSAAITSRFLDSDTGSEKGSFGIGRIFYHANRTVTLCNGITCADNPYMVGALSPTEPASPLVGFGSYALNQKWSMNTNVAYDPRYHDTQNALVNLQYKPATNHIINVGYNFVQYGDPFPTTVLNPSNRKNNLSQLTASTAWPIMNKFDGMAGWNYNLSHEHFQTYFYGLSYNACCYAMRIGMTRTFYALNGNGDAQFTRKVVLQLLLKGFGGVGQNNMLNTINANVPGYDDTFNKNVY